MDRLIDIVARHDTDKESFHRYVSGFYEETFQPLRESAKLVVEIGVYRGGSIGMWRDYFSRAVIVGVDVDEAGFVELDRCVYMLGDAYTGGIVPANADIVIDDGPHTRESQIEAVRRFLPGIADGGMLVIEDIQPPDRDATLRLLDAEASAVAEASGRSISTGSVETETDAGDSVIWWARCAS